MSLTRLLGMLTLAAGGSLLLSEPLIGQDLLGELTGTALGALQLVGAVSIVLGFLAVRVGMREEQEFPAGGETRHGRTTRRARPDPA